MPKQVRLRRGTTAQHATFTGADGEVTVDTSKKVLVLHDGVTAGGKPLEGFLKLDPGNPLVEQTVLSVVHLSGGNGLNYTLWCNNPAFFGGQVDFDAGAGFLGRFAREVQGLPYGASVALDFGAGSSYSVDLAGDVAFTTANLLDGRLLDVKLKADGSTRTLSFPVGWKFLGAAAPVSLAANKTALLQLRCYGATNAGVVARYLVEP